jgi:hypothetical protein
LTASECSKFSCKENAQAWSVSYEQLMLD